MHEYNSLYTVKFTEHVLIHEALYTVRFIENVPVFEPLCRAKSM